MLFLYDGLVLCEECCKWIDDVETTVDKHLNEFKPVVHAKTWKNESKNRNRKVPVFI